MKTVLSKLSDEQAKKEVNSRTYWLLGASIVTFFILWPLAAVVVALSARNFVLTYHEGNRKRKDLLWFRIMNGAAIVLSVATLVINFAN